MSVCYLDVIWKSKTFLAQIQDSIRIFVCTSGTAESRSWAQSEDQELNKILLSLNIPDLSKDITKPDALHADLLFLQKNFSELPEDEKAKIQKQHDLLVEKYEKELDKLQKSTQDKSKSVGNVGEEVAKRKVGKTKGVA